MGLGALCKFKWDPTLDGMVAYTPRRECGSPVAWAWYRRDALNGKVFPEPAHYSCELHYERGSKTYNTFFVYERITPQSIAREAEDPRLIRQRIVRVRRNNVPGDDFE